MRGPKNGGGSRSNSPPRTPGMNSGTGMKGGGRGSGGGWGSGGAWGSTRVR